MHTRHALLLVLTTGCMGPWQAEWSKSGDSTAVDTDDTDDTDDPTDDTGETTGDDTATADDTATTDDTGGGEIIAEVEGSLLTDTLWTSDTVYVLTGPVFVESTARLTIEAGTTIRGQNGSALIVTRDADIYARGDADEPIVFTSAEPVGERERGDWGGVVLLGNAPLNTDGSVAQIEGIDATDTRGGYGGAAATGSCGLFEYVRIEFAGFEAFAGNELNGLTLGGCGSGTIIRNVQVHKTLDDGIEVFGGTVDLRNAIVSHAKDDAFDWDLGWKGRVQFAAVLMDPVLGDHGIEADNSEFEADWTDTPFTEPTFYNVTFLGGGNTNADLSQRAMLFRRGTGGHVHNFIATAYNGDFVDVRDGPTVDHVTAGELEVTHGLVYAFRSDATGYFSDETAEDDDGGFDEQAWLTATEASITFDVDPQLPLDFNDPLDPSFTPAGESAAASGGKTPPQDEFWDQSATYLGAVRPGDSNPWTDGWTSFPEN